jgi:hypothetical protein
MGFWRFSRETFPRIPAARKAADLVPDGLRIVAIAKLHADAILAIVVERAVILPTA